MKAWKHAQVHTTYAHGHDIYTQVVHGPSYKAYVYSHHTAMSTALGYRYPDRAVLYLELVLATRNYS